MTVQAASGNAHDDPSLWRQADTFSVNSIAITSDAGEPVRLETPDGVVLVSQSCDVVLPHRHNVQVAPVVRLDDTQASEARAGKRSQYAHVPQMGDMWFADLDCVGTIAKSALLGKRARRGVVGDDETRRFSAAIARRFGRFAFPDDVSDAMKVLRDLVQSRAVKPDSPFGRVLAQVLELRAEAKPWVEEGSEVTLVFVLIPGSLPTLPDDDPGEVPATVSTFIPDISYAQLQLTEIAKALTNQTAMWNAYEKFWLWTFLADAAAVLCESRGRSTGTQKHPTFIGEVVSGDEFPLTRVRRSEIVDLDHLSPPVP